MTRRTERLPLPAPSPGTARELVVHRYGQPGQGPKVYMQASLHADEWPGMMAIHHLVPLLDDADAQGLIKGELVLVPYANPIGLDQRPGGAASGRYAFDGSGNFNRNWINLAEQAAPLLEGRLTGDAEQDVETVRAAFRQVVADAPSKTEIDFWRNTLTGLSCDADYVLDLHCDGEAEVHIYANERQGGTATDLAKDMDCPVVLLESTAGGGAFDEAASAPWWWLGDILPEAANLPHACFGTTVELRGRQDVSDEYGRKDAAGLMSFLRRIDVVDGAATPAREEVLVAPLNGTDVVHATAAGLVSYTCELGQQVKVGDTVAVLIDPAAENPAEGRVELVSRANGRFFARGDQRMVTRGEGIAKVAGTTPLAHRQEGKLLEA